MKTAVPKMLIHPRKATGPKKLMIKSQQAVTNRHNDKLLLCQQPKILPWVELPIFIATATITTNKHLSRSSIISSHHLACSPGRPLVHRKFDAHNLVFRSMTTITEIYSDAQSISVQSDSWVYRCLSNHNVIYCCHESLFENMHSLLWGRTQMIPSLRSQIKNAQITQKWCTQRPFFKLSLEMIFVL